MRMGRYVCYGWEKFTVMIGDFPCQVFQLLCGKPEGKVANGEHVLQLLAMSKS